MKHALQFSLSSVKKGIDELVSRKETIGIRGIACQTIANGAPHKGVLIIGAPGIGKTSLVRWLCLGWAQGKLLQHYDMVILLQLRDRCLITAKSIGETGIHTHTDITIMTMSSTRQYLKG